MCHAVVSGINYKYDEKNFYSVRFYIEIVSLSCTRSSDHTQKGKNVLKISWQSLLYNKLIIIQNMIKYKVVFVLTEG
jgi:hypothetical protein